MTIDLRAIQHLHKLRDSKSDKIIDYANMDLLPFIVEAHKKMYNENFVVKNFHEEMAELFTKCAMRTLDSYILVINMPPRYSKTQFLIYYMMWCYLKNEMARFIYATYSHKLSLKTSREVKKGLIDVFGKRAALSKESAELWELHKGGALWATSMQGSVTGFGAGDLYATPCGGDLILDDPNKVSDCFYETIRNSVQENFMQTFWSRRNNQDKIPIILTQQRIHTDDLSGWLMKDSKFRYNQYSIRALDVNNEATFPERVSKETLLELKEASPYTFAAQQQQEPQGFGGNFFLINRTTLISVAEFRKIEWIQKCFVRSYDLAGTSKQTKPTDKHDWTRGVLICTDGEKIYILNVVSHKGTVDQNAKLICKTAESDGHQVVITVPIDPGHAGEAYVDYLQNVPELGGYSLHPIRPTGNKQLRAAGFASFLNVGKVVIVADEEDEDKWNMGLLEELASFPFGRHDDQVDCLSDAFTYLHAIMKYL